MATIERRKKDNWGWRRVGKLLKYKVETILKFAENSKQVTSYLRVFSTLVCMIVFPMYSRSCDNIIESCFYKTSLLPA